MSVRITTDGFRMHALADVEHNALALHGTLLVFYCQILIRVVRTVQVVLVLVGNPRMVEVLTHLIIAEIVRRALLDAETRPLIDVLHIPVLSHLTKTDVQVLCDVV